MKDWELSHLLLASLLFTFSEPVLHSLQLSVLLLSVCSSRLGKLTNAKCRDICPNIPREIQVVHVEYKYTSVCSCRL